MTFRRRRNHQHRKVILPVSGEQLQPTGHVAPTPYHLSVSISATRSSTAPHATSMTAPNPAHRASAATSTSALSSEQSSCPCARTNACRCVWPFARFASVNATWSATSALRGDSTAGRTHPLPTLHDYLSDPMYDNLVCAFLAYVDRFKSCYSAPSSSR